MKKFMFVVILTFSISAIGFCFDYWYLDVTVENINRGTSSVQRAYFFRDLATLESATGFPRKENEDRINRYRWKWEEITYIPNTHHATILSVMRRDGFKAAFVLSSSGISITGEPYYVYTVYFISNDREYYDFANIYNKPVK